MSEFFDWFLNATAVYIFIGGGGFGLATLFLTIIACIVIPSGLLQRFLVEPYFSKRECFIYSFWPGLFLFVGMLMFAMVFPDWRGSHKRNLKEVRQVSPFWFQSLLYVMAFSVTGLWISMIVLFVAVGGHLLFV